jgi:uncharacterized protein (TIGR03437 family)
VVFAVLLGGSASSAAEAVALTAQGQILVSGVSNSAGFPTTPGAFSVSSSAGKPFLIELDASASTLIFSATGIGGSSIAVDGAGNIYVSGSTTALDYPTTPGVYQQTFAPAFVCSFPPCQTTSPALQQYLTKVDSTGSRLIYSTGVNDQTPNRSGNTINTGLAVDAAGNAYLTGLAGGPYPFTVAVPSNAGSPVGFVTKLNSAATSVFYAVLAGGAGVQIDSAGAVYAGGVVNGSSLPTVLGWVASACLPGAEIASTSEAYVAKLDPTTGDVLDAQWIDGSALALTALTLASGKLWTAGTTQRPDVPLTPGALFPSNLTPGPLPGGYLGAVDFSQPTGNGPLIGCVLDGADFMHTGPVAPSQILSIFGANLGPSPGVAAAGGSAASLAGVTATFDGNSAPLLYVSSSQINIAVPNAVVGQKGTILQVLVNGTASVKRQLPVTSSNVNTFINSSGPSPACPGSSGGLVGGTIQVLAINADGTVNTCANPAPLGSVVSFYLEGSAGPELTLAAQFGPWSAQVINTALEGPLVWKADVLLPPSLPPTGFAIVGGHEAVDVLLTSGTQAVGPFNTGGQPLAAALWVK